ncbi:DUF4097 family beta strand repeat-containing protein [Peribacillus sp. JNUCC 23]
MSLLVLGSLNSYKKHYEYRSNIKNVNKVQINSDFSNIKLISKDSDFYLESQGVGKPTIDITYTNDKAIINVLTFNKTWKKMLPGKKNRGKILLNIPPRLLDELHLETKNGDIDIDYIAEVSRLSLISDVGTIRLSGFQGEFLNIKSGNGSINLGEVNGQINIKNKVGSLKSLVLKSVKGENNIKISNGNVKVELPKGIKTDDIGLNISTKNGKIISKDSNYTISNKGPGKELIQNVPNSTKKLNISVLVGNIEIN